MIHMNIKIENLKKEFKDTIAIDNLNLNIEEGELLSILGPSGCGKSTLLFIVSGVSKATSGNIYFGDKIVNEIEAEDREIGMVFQNYALYPHMTVLQNVMFPLKMKKIKKNAAKDIAMEIMRLVHIEDLAKRKPSQLSGGQQQRVAIARALVKKPKILLLDEPLSNLDAKLRFSMREEIKRIQNETNITTIFVTHDQEEAMSISDNILLMKKGKVQQYGRPKELYKNPINRFTAEFIGNPTINTFFGKLKEEIFNDTNLSFSISNCEINDRRINKNKEDIYLCIRPEDICLSDSNQRIHGVVKDIENLGKEQLIRVELENKKVIRFIITWDEDIDVGSKLNLDFKKVHLFSE